VKRYVFELQAPFSTLDIFLLNARDKRLFLFWPGEERWLDLNAAYASKLHEMPLTARYTVANLDPGKPCLLYHFLSSVQSFGDCIYDQHPFLWSGKYTLQIEYVKADVRGHSRAPFAAGYHQAAIVASDAEKLAAADTTISKLSQQHSSLDSRLLLELQEDALHVLLPSMQAVPIYTKVELQQR
jgi:hypothetical protein